MMRLVADSCYRPDLGIPVVEGRKPSGTEMGGHAYVIFLSALDCRLPATLTPMEEVQDPRQRQPKTRQRIQASYTRGRGDPYNRGSCVRYQGL